MRKDTEIKDQWSRSYIQFKGILKKSKENSEEEIYKQSNIF